MEAQDRVKTSNISLTIIAEEDNKENWSESLFEEELRIFQNQHDRNPRLKIHNNPERDKLKIYTYTCV